MDGMAPLTLSWTEALFSAWTGAFRPNQRRQHLPLLCTVDSVVLI
jgi:hypothetical protein